MTQYPSRPRVLVCALLISLASPAVLAQTSDEIKKSPTWQTAKKYHEVAQQLYQTGNYAQAVVEFKKAYDLAPLPELLHNIGRCYEVLGELERAVKNYRLFLEKKPDAPNRAVLEARLLNLEKRIAAQAKPAPKVEPKPAPKVEPEPEPIPEPTSPGRSWRWNAGWVGVGVGAAALVSGVVFGALASDKASQFEDGKSLDKKTYTELLELEDQGQTYENAQVGLLISGAVVGLAGAGLLIWELLRDPEREGRTLSFLPYVDSTGGGVAGIIRF